MFIIFNYFLSKKNYLNNLFKIYLIKNETPYLINDF